VKELDISTGIECVKTLADVKKFDSLQSGVYPKAVADLKTAGDMKILDLEKQGVGRKGNNDGL
jgi:hypothetical protein